MFSCKISYNPMGFKRLRDFKLNSTASISKQTVLSFLSHHSFSLLSTEQSVHSEPKSIFWHENSKIDKSWNQLFFWHKKIANASKFKNGPPKYFPIVLCEIKSGTKLVKMTILGQICLLTYIKKTQTFLLFSFGENWGRIFTWILTNTHCSCSRK